MLFCLPRMSRNMQEGISVVRELCGRRREFAKNLREGENEEEREEKRREAKARGGEGEGCVAA